MSPRPRVRVHCHIRGCKRSVWQHELDDTYPKADGWAVVVANYSGWQVHICPIHRLELEDDRSITPKARPPRVYGQEDT